jgi:enoyl-CoA hydratase/carnithine racemase
MERSQIDEPVVLTEQRGFALWVTLSRPRAANALSSELVQALHRVFVEAEQNPDLKGVVFRGAGPNFCGGADLRELLSGGAAHVRTMMNEFRDFILHLERSPLLTIAAVHGAARAGGLELCLACDVVIASKSASFGDAHVANALLPAGGATVRLPRSVGWARAKWLILSAEPIAASIAQSWGLVLSVVADQDLAAEAERLAALFEKKERAVLQGAKHLLASTFEQPMSALLEKEIAAFVSHSTTEAFQNGVRNFLTKRAD